MAAGAQVDYDALAQQHGGIASVSGSGMDYDALAASHGGAVSNDSADPNAAIAKKYGLPSGTDLSKPYFSQSTKGIDPLAFSKAYAEANPAPAPKRGFFANAADELKGFAKSITEPTTGVGVASAPPVPGADAINIVRQRAAEASTDPMGALGRTTADVALTALPFVAGPGAEAGGDAIRSGWRKIGNPMGLASTGEELLTQGISPRTSMTNFAPSLQRAAGDLKAFDADSPIQSVEDLNDAIPEIKQKIWNQEVAPALARQAGKPVNMKPVADAVRAQISDEMRTFDEPNAEKLDKLADKLDSTKDVTSANNLLKYINGQLESYFQKFPAARKANLMNNPETAGWEAARAELRNQFLSTLEANGETGVRDARLRYGALDTLQDAVERRVNVAARAKPMSLGRIVGLAAAPGTGGTSIVLGELSNYLNKPDVLVRRGIALLPSGPESMPSRTALPPPISLNSTIPLSALAGMNQKSGTD